MIKQYHPKITFFFLALLLVCLSPLGTKAASPVKTFAVLPLKVNGPQKFRYLSKGIQDMLTTRLDWKGHFEPAINFSSAQSNPTTAQAKDLLNKNSLNFLLWGSITILGQEASLDLKVINDQGQIRTESVQSQLEKLLPGINRLAQKINYQIFQNKKLPQPADNGKSNDNPVAGSATTFASQAPAQENQAWLNPQFRYENRNTTQGLWRSRSLPFASKGMVVCDADGDGKNEIFLLQEHKIQAVKIEKNRIVKLGEKKFSRQLTLLMLNGLDLDQDGRTELVLCAVDSLTPASMILTFHKGKFAIPYKKIPLFLNVLRTPPDFSRTLTGQRGGNGEIFSPGIYEVQLNPKGYTLGKRFLVPDRTTIFNCTFYPTKNDFLIILSKSNEPLKTYSSTAGLLYKSKTVYSGSSNRVQVPNSLPGLGENKEDPTQFYYLPIRRLVCNLDQDDQFELLISHNISLSSKIFSRFRSFPQGEIHALGWDGAGMSTIWKTKTLQGSITDFCLADANNDGQQDLVICLTTYPGLTGLGNIKTIVFVYPLQKGN